MTGNSLILHHHLRHHNSKLCRVLKPNLIDCRQLLAIFPLLKAFLKHHSCLLLELLLPDDMKS